MTETGGPPDEGVGGDVGRDSDLLYCRKASDAVTFMESLQDSFRGEGYFEPVSDLSKRDPSRYYTDDEDSSSSLIKLIVETALASLSDEEQSSVECVPVGLLPTHQPNAMAMLVPGGGYCVGLDWGLIRMLSGILDIFFATALHDPEYARKVGFGEPLSKTHLARYAASTCLFYTTSGILGAEMTFAKYLPPKSYSARMALTLGIEKFIMLHEYGHILLGHYSNDSFVEKRIGRADARMCFGYAVDVSKENEADKFGYERLVKPRSANERERTVESFMAAAAVLFFEVIQFVDRASVILRGKKYFVSDEHPTPEERMHAALGWYFGRGCTLESYSMIQGFARIFLSTLEEMEREFPKPIVENA